MEEQQKKLRETIERETVPPKIEEEKPAEPTAPAGGEKVLLKNINVTGITLLSRQEIENVTAPFKEKESTLREMQKITQAVTDAYRKKGYITSRAVLPPQRVENNTLEIHVIEGKTGEIKVEGNRYFKTSLITKRLRLKQGDIFDYNLLQKSLVKLNEYPDRKVRAVLAPGKKTGLTDVLLKVEDRLPIHLGLSFDNYASRYVRKNRYQGTLTDNNLLGFDDILTFQYQTADDKEYQLNSVRYLFPVNDSTQFGLFGARTDLHLGEEFTDLKVRGKSRLYSAFLDQNLFKTNDVTLKLNLGFDYKDVFNFQLNNESSRDRLRVAKVGLNFDMSDKWGRTILNNETGFGIPNIMGGSKSKDSRSSRQGAGGEFIKDTIDFLRLQKMPFDSTLLLKSQFQMTSRVLPSVEQLQLGGIVNVRGYPPGEVAGDYGQTVTGEWTFPVYFIPKKFKLPFLKTNVYDAVKIAAFYDWGRIKLRNTGIGERKVQSLKSVGTGIRVDLPKNFSVRVDTAWALDQNPSDADPVRTWIKVVKEF